MLEYWDYQGIASFELGARDTLTLFGFGAFDFAGNEEGEVLGSLEFHRLDLRYDHEFGDTPRPEWRSRWVSTAVEATAAVFATG